MLGCRWVVAALGEATSLDGDLRDRALAAMVAYTNTAQAHRAASASGDRRQAMKRKLKLVLRDLASVAAGTAAAADCIYDLTDL